MANPNPSKHTRFAKGNRANPLGAAAHNHELKKIRRLSNDELAEAASILLYGNTAAIKMVLQDSNAPVLQAMIASVVDRVITKGDMYSFDMLLSRLIGKPKENIEVQNPEEKPRVCIYIPSNGRERPADIVGQS